LTIAVTRIKNNATAYLVGGKYLPAAPAVSVVAATTTTTTTTTTLMVV